MDCVSLPSDISIALDNTATTITFVEASDVGTALLQASPVSLPESSGHVDESSVRPPASSASSGGHLPMVVPLTDPCHDESLSSLPPILESCSRPKGNLDFFSVPVAVPCLDSQILDLSDPLWNRQNKCANCKNCMYLYCLS